jgi:retron-type reverse transcriptase
MPVDLLAIIENWGAPLSQEDYFASARLVDLFQSKIAKSQATGKDGVRIGRFELKLVEETQLIERRVRAGNYRFTAFKERLLLRGADRAPRQISIPTVRDRLTLRGLCQVLHDHVPETRGAAPHALVNRVVAAIREGSSEGRSFVRIDVKDFFPSVSHAILRREIRHFGLEQRLETLCLQAIETPTGATEGPNNRGIPQGLSVSGALSALYMIRFDRNQLSRNTHYFRYVDDILVICETKDADDTLKKIGLSLSSRGLIIHKKGVLGKTEISRVDEGIDFLGYRISVGSVSIRQSSFRRMFKNILKVITDYRYRKDINRLIFRLNLKITGCTVDARRRGWMMFFSHTEDMRQLSHLDGFVKAQLRRVGFPADRMADIKRFIKSYHEIKYNLLNTSYIPNLNLFSIGEKILAIAALSHRAIEEISTWDVLVIDQEFSRLMSREVHDLEQDVGNPS